MLGCRTDKPNPALSASLINNLLISLIVLSFTAQRPTCRATFLFRVKLVCLRLFLLARMRAEDALGPGNVGGNEESEITEAERLLNQRIEEVLNLWQ